MVFLSDIRFGKDAKIVHFIGPVKPWQHQYLSAKDTVILSPGTYSSQIAAQDFIRRWWQVYCSTEQVCWSRILEACFEGCRLLLNNMHNPSSSLRMTSVPFLKDHMSMWFSC